ncbi:MAG TPA: sugar ABC transporter substrate-binding protein [Trebonia sp.]|nr:sugar ABC transporter substrate-binding protein [Trebonia sp.]
MDINSGARTARAARSRGHLLMRAGGVSLAVLVAAGLAACSTSSGTSASSSAASTGAPGSTDAPGSTGSKGTGKSLTIGLASEGLSTTFSAQMVAGAKAAAAEDGAKLTVLDGKYAVSTQYGDVQDLIAAHVDGVILDPVVAGPAGDMVKLLTQAGIPVVLMHTPAGSDTDPTAVDAGVAAEVAENEVLAGAEAAKLAEQAAPAGGDVGIVQGVAGTAQATQRTSGFTSAIGSKFKIVGEDPGDWTPKTGLSDCQNMLQAHPDVAVFYTESDDMATGCLQAVRQAGSSAKIVSIGGETSVKLQIQQGAIYGTVCFLPVSEGQQALSVMASILTHKANYQQKFITYPLTPVTKSNLSACGWQWS